MSRKPEALICAHCFKSLTMGRGEFYVVQIEAIADASPMEMDPLNLEEVGAKIDAIISQLNNITEEDAMTQVIRRVVLYLCYPCYRKWIENPTDRNDEG